jgi:hypothetical protein
MENQSIYNVNLKGQEEAEVHPGNWVIIQLFGHKVMAGYATKEEPFGLPMIRIDVPETEKFPAFSKHISPQAVYDIAYVSETAARKTAEAVQADPIPVYVPEIDDARALHEQVMDLKEQLSRARALPDPEFRTDTRPEELEPGLWDEEDEEDDWRGDDF